MYRADSIQSVVAYKSDTTTCVNTCCGKTLPSLHKCHIQSNELQRTVGLCHFYLVCFSNFNAENILQKMSSNLIRIHNLRQTLSAIQLKQPKEWTLRTLARLGGGERGEGRRLLLVASWVFPKNLFISSAKVLLIPG